MDISIKELVPVTIASGLWGPQWSGKHICFHSDNMAVVAVLQRRSAKTPPMHLLHCVSLVSAFYGFHLSAWHVPGVSNGVADALSRNKSAHVSSFISQVPKFHLPDWLCRLLISERPNWGSQSSTELFASYLTVVSPSLPRRCTSQANAAPSQSAASFP